MERFILGYVVFGITTMLYEWNRYFRKEDIDESFAYVIRKGGAEDLPDNIQRILFWTSSVIMLVIYGAFWPKAIYDAFDEWYHKED